MPLSCRIWWRRRCRASWLCSTRLSTTLRGTNSAQGSGGLKRSELAFSILWSLFQSKRNRQELGQANLSSC